VRDPTGNTALVAILDGAEGERRVRITAQLTVGRGEDAGLLIDDPEISRAHAVLASTGDGLEIEDLGSLNGTWVNGERITNAMSLAPGDMIKVGTTRIEVVSVSVAPEGAPSPQQRASPTPVAAEDELRPVSALFADIVGSTALAEQLAPEDFTALIGGCIDRMCRAVEQFGGVIDAYMGDGIAAFFGFPTANEHDADRAARAALSIVKSIDGYAAEVRKVWKLPDLSVRVGVNSGQVAIGVVGGAERHPVALGDTMNVAARLQTAAAPGTIVVGAATARKLAGRFLLAPLGHIAVRGRQTPVEALRLLRARPERARREPGSLIGRTQEIARLEAAAEALRAGRGQVVLLVGEPGIGKTRLLDWFRGLLGDEVTWLEGHCASFGGQPSYFAFTEVLRGWLADDSAARPTILARLGIDQEALPYFATLLSASSGREAHRPAGDSPDAFGAGVRDAYGGWLRGLCEQKPVVVAIHDLHWADHCTVELAEGLLELVAHLPLIIVATSRLEPDSYDRRLRERARLDHADRMVELELGPLTNVEADQLLFELAPGELAAEARRELIARAEGNPLYLEQLLRSLLETGGLAPHRTWALTVPAAQLPTGLESLLMARIAALPRDARRLAQVAAVFGRTFSPTVLALIETVEDVERDLARLLRADIIRETRPIPDREYAFTHGLLQEAALSTLTRGRRRELYRMVAAASEQAFAGSLDDELERLAFYRARGGDLALALEYLERAAGRATSLRAHTQSIDLLRRAAAVAEELEDAAAKNRIQRQLSELGSPSEVPGSSG
jgi:class 3 adenylate cyclase